MPLPCFLPIHWVNHCVLLLKPVPVHSLAHCLLEGPSDTFSTFLLERVHWFGLIDTSTTVAVVACRLRGWSAGVLRTGMISFFAHCYFTGGLIRGWRGLDTRYLNAMLPEIQAKQMRRKLTNYSKYSFQSSRRAVFLSTSI